MPRDQHLLLASSNPHKLMHNLEHIISKKSLNAIRKELINNTIELFRLGEEHHSHALRNRNNWRQCVSRCYYAAYNYTRAVRLFIAGDYSTDVKDHDNFKKLPEDFPNKDVYSNRLRALRSDRNICDYGHSENEIDLVNSADDAIELVEELKVDILEYFRNKARPIFRRIK